MLSLICNRVKALMGISTEFYSDKIDINFIDVNARPFSTFVNQVLKFYPHFACSERHREFPIKYGEIRRFIHMRQSLSNTDSVIIVAYGCVTL